ncbi:SWIM zinc finger family protein [Bacillus sp. REN16]|uniref:SWIM zinc finger family protein n=1 Tax=Bacillus sp. REN16 TaxID=2887296 RepID=UPI001E622049|nr:hypothetical protein [Bacillus sp. REN16]MCC3357878.1 hypothetical protein [Bacillus sp. REN16]
MNINNFESYIDKVILDRGYNYYIAGNVVEAYEQGEMGFVFQIEGSDVYELVVEIGVNGEILYSECDCPYDFGPVCKHEVAAYFQLFEMLNQGDRSNTVTKKTYKRPSLKDVLYNLSKEELIDIIINISHNDPVLKNSILVKYSKGDHQLELETSKKLIDSIVKKHTGREGFIKYRNTGDFVYDLGDVLDKARDTENALLGLDISILLLEEAIEAFQYADDSGGDIGGLITDILELVGEMANNCIETDHQKMEAFEKLLELTDSEIFDGWVDYKIDLLNVCFEFAEDETLREKLKIKIESMLNEKTNDRYLHYGNESLLQLLFQLIEQYGTQEEAEQFINEHLQYSSFRQQLLNKLIREKNYHKVIEVAQEGEKQDKKYAGLVSSWKKYRYSAYKFLSLKEEQQTLAKELLLNGDFEYYWDLKELASENQEQFYSNLKHELKLSKGWHNSRIFLKLIEEENDLVEMLEFVRMNPSYIETYAEKLVKPYEEEIIKIYEIYIKLTAGKASNRRDYRGVCNIITRYKKFAGKREQTKLIDELIDLYRKRPAFIDELGKIK